MRLLCEWSRNHLIAYLLPIRWARYWRLLWWKRRAWLRFRGRELWFHLFLLSPILPCLSQSDRPVPLSLLLQVCYNPILLPALSALPIIKPVFPFPAAAYYSLILAAWCGKSVYDANSSETVWYFPINLFLCVAVPFIACYTVHHNPAARVQNCFSWPIVADNGYVLPTLQKVGFWVEAIPFGMLRNNFRPAPGSACSVLVFSTVRLSVSYVLLWNRRGKAQVSLSFWLGNRRILDHRFLEFLSIAPQG